MSITNQLRHEYIQLGHPFMVPFRKGEAEAFFEKLLGVIEFLERRVDDLEYKVNEEQ